MTSKQLTLSLLMALTMASASAGVQPKHRHTPLNQPVATAPATGQQQNVQQRDAQTTAQEQEAQGQDVNNDEGQEAYSDTTNVDSAESTTYNSDSDYYDDDDRDLDELEQMSHIFRNMMSPFGPLVAIVVVLAILIFLLAPVIIVALIIRYLIKRNNERVALTEKAIASGQPLPQDLRSEESQDPEYQWKRGIQNLALGLGLVMLAGVIGFDLLIGVGLLIACLGAGKMLMARTSATKKSKRNEEHREEKKPEDTHFEDFGETEK